MKKAVMKRKAYTRDEMELVFVENDGLEGIEFFEESSVIGYVNGDNDVCIQRYTEGLTRIVTGSGFDYSLKQDFSAAEQTIKESFEARWLIELYLFDSEQESLAWMASKQSEQ